MHTNLIKLFIVSSLLFYSCKPTVEENETVPETILKEDVLVDVLADAYLAEGASGINVKNVSGEKFDSVYAFNPINDHRIDKAVFDSSMAYYTRHPKKLKIIYEKVLNKLSILQANEELKHLH